MTRLFIAAICLSVSIQAALAQEKVDHVATIKGLRYGDQKSGRALYALNCASCHGAKGELALNPLARRFAKDAFKFGSDPFAIWKTISYGNGLMFRWDAVLTAKQRYQIVHFIREEILKENNTRQYFTPSDDYFAKLPAIAAADAKAEAAKAQKVEAAPGMIDGSGGKNMVYGPFMQHGIAYTENKNKNAEFMPNVTEKAIVVDLPGQAVICYDAHRLSVSGLWYGKTAITDKSHHTSYKGGRCLSPGSTPLHTNIDAIGWAVDEAKATKTRDHYRYNGLYLHGGRVVLSYSVGGRDILESPGANDDGKGLWRSFRVGPGETALFCLVASKGMKATGGKLVKGDDGATWLSVPPSKKAVSVSVALGDTAVKIEEVDLQRHTKGGPRRWPQTVQTAVAPGTNIAGYAADELTLPLANPWGCWMRTTALDFFSDGRMAVSTLSGDVWIVSWTKENPNALTWSRYASGLYEPLGLKIVDDTIYVRGRDRITRLHDLNKTGEADFYENFYEEPDEIGASYHAFIFELQTDRAGNFYFSQSGYKSPLTGGVVKISPEGKYAEFVGTDLRNPNGMGAGGPKDWVTITDNPSGKAVYNGFFLAKKGATYGYKKGRTVPMLVMLPARIDSSSGGQCWTDAKDWGPLSGSVIHTSYSRCAAFYCFIQDIEPYPNGFAVQFPFPLKSGAMRPRVNPVDKQVYLTCQKGWDTSARYDGAIYRIRHTGEPARGVRGAAVTSTGLRLTFAADLDPTSVKASAFTGIRESDKKDKKNPGAKPPQIKLGAVRLVDARTVEVDIPDIGKEALANRTDEKGIVTVNPPISLTFTLKSKDGTAIEQTIHATINSVPLKDE